MVSTFTPNINLEEPARGDQVGTWDTPVNSNMTLVDRVAGAINVITLNNSPVVLSAAQFQSKSITFVSTLTGSVDITFPSTFTKSYEIYHTCTGSSIFIITLRTTVAGGQAISCPPGEIVDVVNDGTNIRFKNLGRVGSYWDHGGSSVPGWVTGCTVPPYLNCDASVFSSATYPFLTLFLGGTTLPDARGNFRATLNQGTARITTGVSALDGNTKLSVGGSQLLALHSHTGTTLGESSNHTHSYEAPRVALIAAGGVGVQVANGTMTNTGTESIAHTHAFQTDNTGTGASANIPPAYIGGITMIRSA